MNGEASDWMLDELGILAYSPEVCFETLWGKGALFTSGMTSVLDPVLHFL